MKKEKEKVWWFTADEHYGHKNIIKYCNRPFDTVEQMDEALMANHNHVVSKHDMVVHAGDFTLMKRREDVQKKYIRHLNGKHIFLEGSHDYWLQGWQARQIWEKKIFGVYFVVCHYAMRVWARSHYNSIHLYGHSHGNLEPVGKQHDIGVDNNNFFPLSATQIVNIMHKRPDNFNLVRRN